MRSCSFGGRISTGFPTAIHPIGTVVFGGSTVRRWTTPLTLTSDPVPINDPLKTAVPVARKDVVLHFAAAQIRSRADEDSIPNFQRITSQAAQYGGVHHHTVLADRDRTTLGRQHRAKAD